MPADCKIWSLTNHEQAPHAAPQAQRAIPQAQGPAMKVASLIPTPVEIGREALVVVLGALVAAVIIGQLPQVRDYIKRQWA